MAEASEIEEDRLVLALHPDVQAIERAHSLRVSFGDEGVAPRGRNGGQDRILGVGQGLVAEIGARMDLGEQPAPSTSSTRPESRMRGPGVFS
jgi:hypothetical protein